MNHRRKQTINKRGLTFTLTYIVYKDSATLIVDAVIQDHAVRPMQIVGTSTLTQLSSNILRFPHNELLMIEADAMTRARTDLIANADKLAGYINNIRGDR